MKYQICLNAVGCLPDCDIYPYIIDDAEYPVLMAIIDELNNLMGDDFYDEPKMDRLIASVTETFKQEQGYVAIPIDGTYILTVEPLTVKQDLERYARSKADPYDVAWGDC